MVLSNKMFSLLNLKGMLTLDSPIMFACFTRPFMGLNKLLRHGMINSSLSFFLRNSCNPNLICHYSPTTLLERSCFCLSMWMILFSPAQVITYLNHSSLNFKLSLPLKNLGPLHYFLEIQAHLTSTGLVLTQPKHIQDLLRWLDLSTSQTNPFSNGLR